jgi:ribonuclease BN (tRNA processing enzyme)
MKITFLGTSHGITEKNQFCSSALISTGGKHYLVDAGAPVLTLLKNHDIPLTDVAGVFITHSHHDHFMGLVTLTQQINEFHQFKDVSFPVFVPDEEDYHRMFAFIFGDPAFHGRLAYTIYGGLTDPYGDRSRRISAVIFDDGNLKVTAIPVDHYQNAHAFLLEAEGKRVVFTGDLMADMPDYPKVITGSDVDLDVVVTEGAHTRLNKPEVMALLKSSRTGKLIISHRYDQVNTDEMVAELVEYTKDKFATVLAYDGMILEV